MLLASSRRFVLRIAVLALGLTAVVALGPNGVAARDEVGAPVIVAVGDLACPSLHGGRGPRVCRSDVVADLVTQIDPDRFLPLGDLQYEDGSLERFLQVYDAQFGHLNNITEPVPGNHEYRQEGAQGYFDYFGQIAHPPAGYYSYRLGSWHLIALNSQICRSDPGCGPGSPQHEWLEAELEDNADASCTLAYMHHPRYDWRPWQKWIRDDAGQIQFGGSETEPFVPMWELLYDHGGDVFLAGHNHVYQRWLPQDAHWNHDPDGIVQFTVGTGGRLLYPLGRPPMPDALVVTQNGAHGVLKMTLHEESYDYAWISAEGQPDYTDSGTGTCN
jgi:hypothetical protein